MSITIETPLTLVSGANRREHWAAKHRRAREHREHIGMLLLQHRRPSWPAYTVTITRLAPEWEPALDDDNLARAAKHVRDGVADYLRIDDGDSRIVWQYAQEKLPGRKRRYAVRVEITERDPHVCPACGQRTPEAA